MDKKPSSSSEKLLEAAVNLLREGKYATCRKHALAARDFDPDSPIPESILAVADVMLADRRNSGDWYSILQVTRPDYGNLRVAKSQYEMLSGLLNLEHNRFPGAGVAVELVERAWDMVNNPGKTPPMRIGRPFWYDYPTPYKSDDEEEEGDSCVVEISDDDEEEEEEEEEEVGVVENVNVERVCIEEEEENGR